MTNPPRLEGPLRVDWGFGWSSLRVWEGVGIGLMKRNKHGVCTRYSGGEASEKRTPKATDTVDHRDTRKTASGSRTAERQGSYTGTIDFGVTKKSIDVIISMKVSCTEKKITIVIVIPGGDIGCASCACVAPM